MYKIKYFKLISLFTTILILLSATLVTSTSAQTPPDPLVEIPGSVAPDLGTPAVSPAIPGQNAVETAVLVLRPKNEAALENLISDLNDPNSPQYQKYLTAPEFRNQFAPDQQAVDEVSQFLKDKGLTISYSSPDKLVLGADGTRGQLDAAFNTTSEYRATTSGESGYINITPLKLPASIQAKVKGVSGFDKLHKLKVASEVNPDSNKVYPASAALNTPAQLRTAYNFTGTGLTGTGTKVGITLWGAPDINDLTRWVNNYGHSLSINILPDTPASTDPVIRYEANMDVQLVHTAAPDTNVRFYVGADNTLPKMLLSISQGINEGVNVLTNSWLTCDATLPNSNKDSYHTVFQSAAVQGIPILFASGDSGVFQCNSIPGYSAWPASDDLVTAVGGTTLDRNDSTFAWQNETGWSCGVPDGFNDNSCYQSNHGSSGGGIATYFARPSYQSITPPNEDKFQYKPTTPMRVVPDISMNADRATGIIVYFASNFTLVCNDNCPSSGTSASAPLLGGAIALAAQRKGAQVGGINTFLYNNESGTAGVFDVTQGYNGVNAKVGWDYVTGLGSLKDVNAFIKAIVPPSPIEVKLPDDYGQPTDNNTQFSLTNALLNVQPYQIIIFNLPIGYSSVVLHGQLPPVKPTTRILGGISCSQPIFLDGSGAAGTTGLELQGKTQLTNLKLINFRNIIGGIKTTGTNNKLSCVSVDKRS